MTQRFQRRNVRSYVMPRDLEIVRSVFEARYMTLSLIQRLLFTPTTVTSAKRRLRALYDLKFLDKREALSGMPDYYFVGLEGRKYLAQEYERSWVDKVAGVQSDARSTLIWMPHEVTLSKLYVNAKLEAKLNGWGIAWKNTRMLELLKLGVQPDAYIKVTKGGNFKEAYIEFTDQLTAGAIIKKIEAYRACLPEAQVLWFASTQRVARLIIKEVDGQFAVAVIENAGKWLTGEIWTWQGEVAPFLKATGGLRVDLQPD